MFPAALIIPCFNEAGRLDRAELGRLAHAAELRLILVDDGSSDATGDELRAIAAQAPSRIEVLALSGNRGKAEAVRAGMLRAMSGGAEVVGYLDADLATPVDEMLRLRHELESRGLEVVTGARVAMVGSQIVRHPSRHYSGRVFATFASAILRAPFYDTQCGAKLFRVSPALRAALAEPFVSRWAFDIELLGRLLTGSDHVPLERLAEIPLRRWTDVPGSKLKLAAMLRTTAELIRIQRALARRREGRGS